ncbi:MAG: hypothetical protein FWF86_03745 [Clostridia bacterium]|nr:hypothetical protein [Clostridia bacterium]
MKKNIRAALSLGVACCLLTLLFILPAPALAALPNMTNINVVRVNASDFTVSFDTNANGLCYYYIPQDPYELAPTPSQMIMKGTAKPITIGANTINTTPPIASLSFGNAYPIYLMTEDTGGSGAKSAVMTETIDAYPPLSNFTSIRTDEENATVTFESSIAGEYAYVLRTDINFPSQSAVEAGTRMPMSIGMNTFNLGNISTKSQVHLYLVARSPGGNWSLRYYRSIPAYRKRPPRTGDGFPYAELLVLLTVIMAASSWLILRERRAYLLSAPASKTNPNVSQRPKM